MKITKKQLEADVADLKLQINSLKYQLAASEKKFKELQDSNHMRELNVRTTMAQALSGMVEGITRMIGGPRSW